MGDTRSCVAVQRRFTVRIGTRPLCGLVHTNRLFQQVQLVDCLQMSRCAPDGVPACEVHPPLAPGVLREEPGRRYSRAVAFQERIHVS
jgi:hypothetical protein